MTFVPLAAVLRARAQAAVGSIVSDRFLVLQKILADAAGRPLAQYPPGPVDTHVRIVEMARGQTG